MFSRKCQETPNFAWVKILPKLGESTNCSCKWSGYISMLNFKPFFPCVLHKVPGNSQDRQMVNSTMSTSDFIGEDSELCRDILILQPVYVFIVQSKVIPFHCMRPPYLHHHIVQLARPTLSNHSPDLYIMGTPLGCDMGTQLINNLGAHY